MVIEVVNGYIVECEKTLLNETGIAEHATICFKVNASSTTNAYRLVQAYIEGQGNVSIKGVVKEYPNQPFVGIML